MSTEQSKTPRPPRRHRRPRPRWWTGPLRLFAGSVILASVMVFAVLAVTGRPLSAPAWVVTQIEARADAALAGQAHVRLGGFEAIVDQSFVPRVRLTGIELLAPGGARLARIESLRASFSPRALLSGRLEPTSLRLSGATVSVRRRADGSLDLPAAGNLAGSATSLRPAEVLDAIDRAFALPTLAGITRIEADGMNLRLQDLQTGQSWSAEGGRLTLDQTAESIAIALGVDLTGPAGKPARAEIDFASRKESPEARVEARVSDVSARDLAAQVPGLAWLSVLDAPISGLIRTGIDESGAVRPTAATLTIGAGALKPDPAAKPVAFTQAKVDLTFDPASGRIAFSEMTMDSKALRVVADGQAWLTGPAASLPEGLVAQVRVSDLRADPEGLFANPVRFSQGAIDLKVEFEPFRVRLGQLVLIEQGRRLSAKGTLDSLPEGWKVALDFGIDAITSDRLLALWPVRVVPKTREWLAANVATAELFDVKAALRLRPGADGVLSLGYEFRDADVTFLRSLPPIRAGAGYATIEGNAYTLVLDRGHVTAPVGGDLDVAGSVLSVPDIREKPARAEVTLRTDSSITAALSILDEPPFHFLTKAERPVDAAEGHARVEARLQFPLTNTVRPEDVRYTVEGVLTDVRSSTLVPGRELLSDRLGIRATPAGMTISGPGTLSGVPFRAGWTQAFGVENRGRSRVAGTVELSQRFLDTFGIALPKGAVRGTGDAEIALDIVKGEPVAFTVTSELNGLALSVPGIGWSKPAGRTGRLEVAGTLGMPGRPAEVTRLSLKASGLEAAGTVTLRRDGSLDAVRLSSVAVGDWFKGAVTIAGQGRGRMPTIAVGSGTADLRRASFGSGGAGGPALDIALDRLTISSGIALSGFRGAFTTSGGFSGRFSGRVNGEAPVQGTAVPTESGTGFRILSDDAGGVFRSAGLFTRGRGGSLDLTLLPTGAGRTYAGKVQIRDIRVVNAPALAELLGAISVIGLLEQLNGAGILFNDARGNFLLTPDAVEVRQASAIGASLGVSARGVFYTTRKELDLVGTISPIYLVNAIGTPFTKRREGLFGFNYRMRGSTDGPAVSVNPLSILTPGMFREIFQTPAPKLDQ